MIKLLHIENIAVIEKADIEFAFGLNVLTGETGAGKSIVIDALSAVTGGRTSREVVRTGAEFASVTAVFSDIQSRWFELSGVSQDESGDIFISRKITMDGKSVCRVNGMPVSATQLRELGAELIDIHGQNDGRKLLDEGSHLSYLDAFGGLGAETAAYREAYKKYKDKKAEIERLSMDESERERRIDTLKLQVQEIERARLREGEFEELVSRRELLLNASKLTDAVETAFESLYGGEDTSGAVALISDAQGQLEHASRYSDGLKKLAERLLDLRYTAQDISDELRDFRAELNFLPEELDELDARLDVLKRINRKYGSEGEALEFLEQGKSELADIEDGENRLAKLEKELGSCLAEAMGYAEKLTELRNAAGAKLQGCVREELSQLSMPGVNFLVAFDIAKTEHGLGTDGRDEVSFLMSANAGEAPGKISRIASGGELARIMLALKNVLSGEQDTGTVVFDEVDSGVSGVAAQRVGEKLAMLAGARQVLCVTHLPQIAAMADTHFEIQKTVAEGRTFTQVSELDFEGRKRELARLSGGENITISALTSAAEQLAAADKFKHLQNKK
ncbi:MAG: DNA repair protein RecN [Oscillospiraceae bacterium]|nr:DNA repair protein RecN [Oscillospiraceae bacterium]